MGLSPAVEAAVNGAVVLVHELLEEHLTPRKDPP
jgi:hypothetical protein